MDSVFEATQGVANLVSKGKDSMSICWEGIQVSAEADMGRWSICMERTGGLRGRGGTEWSEVLRSGGQVTERVGDRE